MLQFNHRDNKEQKMIGVYYTFLVIISVPVYILSGILRERKKKIGTTACYVFLFMIALLFL